MLANGYYLTWHILTPPSTVCCDAETHLVFKDRYLSVPASGKEPPHLWVVQYADNFCGSRSLQTLQVLPRQTVPDLYSL